MTARFTSDIPPNILAQARLIARRKSARRDLLNSDATHCPPAGQRKPPIYAIPIAPRPLPTRDPQQATFLRLHKLLRFSSRANAVHSDRNNQPRDPLDSSSHEGKQRAREPRRKTAHIANVPLGQATYGDVVGVDDGVRPFVLFFCLSWFQKKEKKPEPRPVYDDDPESDEEEENVLDPVAVPPPGYPKPVRSQNQFTRVVF
ncbi:hypothetical protein BDR07DRAFT_1409084 [Suillus spraguei]|nr:hypothetical protein BDR07DRAFT_1409084 [Suillus spraguei]